MPSSQLILNPDEATQRAIVQGLHAHNASHIGEDIYTHDATLAIAARNDSGDIIGGVIGEVHWDWLHVHMLYLDAAFRGRGIGSRLLCELETEAKERGMIGSHVETASFQARGFYEKQGYAVFGTIENRPIGHVWYYMSKQWAEPAG